MKKWKSKERKRKTHHEEILYNSNLCFEFSPWNVIFCPISLAFLDCSLPPSFHFMTLD